jgi:hypothetical protein
MPFSLKENEAEARERLRAFWAGSSLGRPALHLTVTRPGYRAAPCPWGEEENKGRDLLPAYHAWRAQQALESSLFLAEAMPGAAFRWGTWLVTVATLAGADYSYHSNSAWVHPLPNLWERPLPVFDPRAAAAQQVEACLRAEAVAVGQRGYVNPPVFLDGLTVLSQFLTPPQLCLEVMDRPAAVRRWSDALTTLYIAAYDHFYRFVQGLGYGDTSAWLQVMAEGKMEAVQTDFAVMLSPRQFADFALPDLRRLTDHLDFSLYHLDGVEQMRFLDLLRTLPKLNGIQWNPQPGVGSPVRWLDAFREIRRRGLSLYVAVETVAEAVQITRALGPDGLMLVLPRLATLAEAEQALRAIQAAC